MYELKLEKFSGPIEKLFELIDNRKMEITEVNLAEVTADFLKYVESLSDNNSPSHATHYTLHDTRLVADFIVIASRLLLIKSKALLPNLELTQEEEGQIKDLEARLAFYKQFKPAIRHLEQMAKNANPAYSRPLFMNLPPVFYPTASITKEALRDSAKKLFESLERVLEAKTVRIALVSLEEKIQEVIERMTALKNTQKFDDLLKEKSKPEVIVLFLAILHLLHRQLIKADQETGFSEIQIERI